MTKNYFDSQTIKRTFAALSFILLSPSAHALKVYRSGNPKDVQTATSSTVCLAGGGDEDRWLDGWKHMMNLSGGGDVVIIQAGGEPSDYPKWMKERMDQNKLPKANSITVLGLEKASDANLPEVEATLRNAEMIFFDGGDQSVYIKWFKDSRLAKAIDEAIRTKKVPVGGTSAGMVLLGGIDFTAKYPSPSVNGGMVRSVDVMKDPMGQFVDFDRSVIVAPFLKGVITETHFSERDRQGRLVGFMARAANNGYKDVNATSIKAIAADEPAAVCYNDKGQARVFGEGKAYFLKGNAPVEQLQPGRPLHWYANQKAVEVYVIQGNQPNAKFDISSWRGQGGSVEYWSVNGQNASTPVFHVYKPDSKQEEASSQGRR